jgi:uncharacterized membrane protein
MQVPNTVQLRARMRSGRTPSIDSAHEPAAASFDTDDEAAGHAAPRAAIEQALAHEGRVDARAPGTRRRTGALDDKAAARRTTVLGAGFVLGLGLGGFIDGILLHQILQWHNMGSAVLPPTTMDAMMQNMRWDGLFHAATLALTIAGVLMLWREGRRGTAPAAPGVLIGQMIFGWGIFNLVEGVIDHQLLGLHHVRDLPAHVPSYDWAFLAVGGAVFIVVGWLLARRAR